MPQPLSRQAFVAAVFIRHSGWRAVATTLMWALDGFAAVAAEHEVTVYSFVTEQARGMQVPSDTPIRCRLFSAGYQELGRVASASPSPAPAAGTVQDVLCDGLRSSGFRPTPGGAQAEQMIIYQWGYMDPRPDETTAAGYSRRERKAMLMLLGAPLALRSDVERSALASALRDDRYFLVVSAYDQEAYTTRGEQRLLWRTHVSVSAHKLSHEQALPLLVGAGAALFGRETIHPRHITLSLRDNAVLRLNSVPGALRPERAEPDDAR